MLQLSTNCWNSAFNAQGSRLIIIVLHIRPVKIYVAAVEELRKKERQDETQFTTRWNSVYHQNWWFSEFHPPLDCQCIFLQVFFNLTLCMTKLRVLVMCLSYFTHNSVAFWTNIQTLYKPWGISKILYPVFF